MIKIGLIQGVHGVNGEVKVLPLTDFPQRFKKGKKVYLVDEDEYKLIEGSRRQTNIFLLKLAGVDSREAAEALRGKYLQVRDEDVMALPDDRFYHFQLLGLDVYEESGEYLGSLTQIIESAANDVYVVKNEREEILLPALKKVVKAVDLSEKRMVVHLLPGLREEKGR